MKTIQIPSTKKMRGKLRTECVYYGAELRICFLEDGSFYRDGGGDQFTPKLPQGSVSKGHQSFQAPKMDLDMVWVFLGKTKLAGGVVPVRDDPTCEESTHPPCP